MPLKAQDNSILDKNTTDSNPFNLGWIPWETTCLCSYTKTCLHFL